MNSKDKFAEQSVLAFNLGSRCITAFARSIMLGCICLLQSCVNLLTSADKYLERDAERA